MVGRGINVANGDALAKEVDAAADIIIGALQVIEPGGGSAHRKVALPGMVLQDAEFHFQGRRDGVAGELVEPNLTGCDS